MGNIHDKVNISKDDLEQLLYDTNCSKADAKEVLKRMQKLSNPQNGKVPLSAIMSIPNIRNHILSERIMELFSFEEDNDIYVNHLELAKWIFRFTENSNSTGNNHLISSMSDGASISDIEISSSNTPRAPSTHKHLSQNNTQNQNDMAFGPVDQPSFSTSSPTYHVQVLRKSSFKRNNSSSLLLKGFSRSDQNAKKLIKSETKQLALQTVSKDPIDKVEILSSTTLDHADKLSNFQSKDTSSDSESIINESRMNCQEEKYRFLFRVYDVNQDNFIDEEEMKIMFRYMVGDSMTDDQISNIAHETLLEYDKDKDGKLKYEEFRSILSS